jgi:hypothetical protein
MCAAAVTGQDSAIQISNEWLTVEWKAGNVAITSKPSGKQFLNRVPSGNDERAARMARVTHAIFGNGEAIEITTASGENRFRLELFQSLPFVLLRSSVSNSAGNVKVVNKFDAFSASVNLSKSARELKTLGTGGLLSPDKNPGSYVWLTVVEPGSRNGVVFGWLTHERGSGVVFSEVEGDAARVNAVVEYGKLRIAPGHVEDLETLAIGYFDDARLGLEKWADVAAKAHKVQLPPQPVGYCTWYSQPHGGASDEKHIVELAAFSATNLAPFGFSVVQIDDKWQAGWKRSNPSSPKKNFTTHDPAGPYPGGMKAAADRIKSLGLTPGIWFMPFAGTAGDPFFDQHLDWFAKNPEGKPYDTPWGGTCLDLTHPGAREYVRDITSRICREWGYQYIKIDGLWTGTATKQLYVNSGYKPDDIGEAVFSDPEKTSIEAYRSGLKLVREAAGENVFILGCNAPQNMRTYGGSFGLVNAMRIGPDNKAEWASLLRGPTFGSRHYFLHGRVWWNDPDPVYVRDSMPLKHAQLICSWVALSGQLNLSSEWIPGLSPERLDILKRTMPQHGLLPRPADLFESEIPSFWLVTDERRAQRRDVVGIFNWEGREQQFDYPLQRLGLDANVEYVAFDFWSNKLLSPLKGRLLLALPSESCMVLAVRPKSMNPQVISTSRHVTQGMMDILSEHWDANSRTLHGRSRVVPGDDYELRIALPGETRIWNVESASVSNSVSKKFDAVTQIEGQLLRLKIPGPSGQELAWSLKFK